MDDLNENCILAIDPGVTTGYTLGYIEDDKILVAPFQKMASCYMHYCILQKLLPKTIIIEDFEVRQTTTVGTILFSCELIGVTRLFVESFGKQENVPRMLVQKAMMIYGEKAFFSSIERLRSYDVYIPGKDWHHSMDAMRHFMHWKTFGQGYQYKEKNVQLVTHDEILELLGMKAGM